MGWTASDNFSKFLKPMVQSSHMQHVKVSRVWTSLKLSYFTPHPTTFVTFCVRNPVQHHECLWGVSIRKDAPVSPFVPFILSRLSLWLQEGFLLLATAQVTLNTNWFFEGILNPFGSIYTCHFKCQTISQTISLTDHKSDYNLSWFSWTTCK